MSGRPEFNPGTRVEYPLRDWQLPPDPHTRRSRIVQSAAQHRDLAKAAGMEINQGYERDSYGGD